MVLNDSRLREAEGRALKSRAGSACDPLEDQAARIRAAFDLDAKCEKSAQKRDREARWERIGNVDPDPGSAERFVASLCNQELDAGRQTSECSGRLLVFAHRAGPGQPAHRWVRAVDDCGRSACTNPVCVSAYTAQRSSRVRDHLDQLGQLARSQATSDRQRKRASTRIGACVLTLPMGHRPTDRRTLARLRRAARKVVAAVVAEHAGLDLGTKRNPVWQLAAVDCWHPEGDSQPGIWHPHIHMLIPGFAYHRQTGKLRSIPVKLSPDAIREIKRSWGLAVSRITGWDPPAGDHSRAVVHWAYRSESADPRRYHHRIRYDFRHWPAWHGPWRAICWSGYMASAVKGRLGIVDPTEDSCEDWPADPSECPVCHRKADTSHAINPGGRPDLSGAPDWIKSAKVARPPPSGGQNGST